MTDSSIPSCGRFCCAATLLATLILFILSFGQINPRQYGIAIDGNFCDFDTQVWENGRWFVGLGRGFVVFPKGYVILEFMKGRSIVTDGSNVYDNTAFEQLSCWTENGQQVDVELSMQVQVIPEKVMGLYRQWETFRMASWHLQANIVAAIKDAAVTIRTELFFSDRETVKNTFMTAVHNRLYDMEYYTLSDFQLREIMLPSAFEGAILDKILTYQMQKKAQYQRDRQLMEENIRRIGVQADMDALKTLVNATAVGERVVEQSRADAVKDFVAARAGGYADFLLRLGFGEDTDKTWQSMHYYMWTKLCPESCQGIKKLMGFKDSMVNV
jgi:hypothetical protein